MSIQTILRFESTLVVSILNMCLHGRNFLAQNSKEDFSVCRWKMSRYPLMGVILTKKVDNIVYREQLFQ